MTNAQPRLTAALSDRYRIERELGQGGMATVYLAEDLKHHRKVAIKVLRPELAAALGAERFLREIETTASLRHPHILPLFDSGVVDPRPTTHDPQLLFYVMPFVEGESLRTRLDREKQLPIDDALQIAREVADALSYAHAHGVIHRDIKPENILLESGHAVVADFGIARAINAAGGEQLTETGMAIGTVQYMSPEQAAGQRDLDGRSDLYALGCVLFEMLAGQAPFTGPTVESIVHQHLMATPPPITQLRPAVPADVAAALQRALAKTPADRFNPVAQFASALRSPTGTVATPAAASAPRSSRAILVGGAVVALAAAALMLLRSRGSAAAALPVIGRTTQVTRADGLEVDPALSPDGENLAYAAGPTTAMQIYVRQVTGGREVALTNDTTDNFRWPRWSPDGSQIAYQSNDGIYLVPALGGVPRRVARADTATLRHGTGSVTRALRARLVARWVTVGLDSWLQRRLGQRADARERRDPDTSSPPRCLLPSMVPRRSQHRGRSRRPRIHLRSRLLRERRRLGALDRPPRREGPDPDYIRQFAERRTPLVTRRARPVLGLGSRRQPGHLSTAHRC